MSDTDLELNNDTVKTDALGADARVFGAESASAPRTSSYGRTALYKTARAALADDPSGSRTNLGLGSMATEDADDYSTSAEVTAAIEAATENAFDKSTDTSDAITEGSTNLFLTADDRIRLDDWPVLVTMLGAKGDGTTDDTTAFQTAASIGGRIYVPPSTYIIDHVGITTSCVFFGAGIKSVLKKKANSCGSSADERSYMFSIENANCTVNFDQLLYHGNFDGQETNYSGVTAANNAVTQDKVDGTIALIGGGFITTQNAVAASSGERLVLRVTNCKLYRAGCFAVYMKGTVDTSAYAELFFHNNECYQLGPTISEYHDGTTEYDGMVMPASGYSGYATGVTSVWLLVHDFAKVNVQGNSFIETRSPTGGTITTGYDYNMYNLPGLAIWISVSTPDGTTDATPEWSETIITGNRIEGLGKTLYSGNGLGCIDFYVRNGNSNISANVFKNTYGGAIRGKTNAKNLVISGNIVENVQNEVAINIVPATYAEQQGRYVITGNVIKGAGAGISVVGNNNPPSDDNSDDRVNSIIIAKNIIEDITGITSENSVFANINGYGWGILAQYAAGVSIDGNIVRRLTGTSTSGREHGINVRGCIGEVIVSGNEVETVTKNGIHVESHVGKVSACGNIVRDAINGINVSNTGSNDIRGNRVNDTTGSAIIGGTSAATSVAITDNIAQDIAANMSSNLYAIDTGSIGGSHITVARNLIERVSNAGTGPAYGMRAAFGTMSDLNSMLIDLNTFSDIEESGIFVTEANGIIRGNDFKECNTSAATAHGAIFINGTTHVGSLLIHGNRTDSTTTPFPTTGGASGDVMRNNAKISEVGNSWQRKEFARSAIPTAGSWTAGDIVWNTAPSISNTLVTLGWQRVTTGTGNTLGTDWAAIIVPSSSAPQFSGLTLAAAGTFEWVGRAKLKSGSDGLMALRNNADSAYGILDAKLRVETDSAPSSASDTGAAGEVRWDGDYVYICTATDTWRRIAHSTW